MLDKKIYGYWKFEIFNNHIFFLSSTMIIKISYRLIWVQFMQNLSDYCLINWSVTCGLHRDISDISEVVEIDTELPVKLFQWPVHIHYSSVTFWEWQGLVMGVMLQWPLWGHHTPAVITRIGVYPMKNTLHVGCWWGGAFCKGCSSKLSYLVEVSSSMHICVPKLGHHWFS